MHYCFVTGLYSRDDVLIFERQGKCLVSAGFKVTYIVCDNLPNEIKEGINIISTGFIPTNRLNRFIKTRKILKKFADKVNADIYQISDPELIYLVKHFKRQGKKVVFNLREYYPDMILYKQYIPKLIRKPLSVFYKISMRKYLKYYDIVFTVTNWLVDILRSDFKLNNVSLLTNFPTVDHAYLLSYEDYINRDSTLCYIGTVYKESKQENVFQALNNISEINYLIAGVIDQNYDIKKHLYWEDVIFVNGFKYNELSKYFSMATISNTLRDFGERDGSLGVIKIFESMEAALPVIFSDVPLYRKIVEKHNCGICVDPNNSQEIEDAIRYLINNKEVAYKMGQNGRKAVVEEYNWETQAEKYIETINKL